MYSINSFLNYAWLNSFSTTFENWTVVHDVLCRQKFNVGVVGKGINQLPIPHRRRPSFHSRSLVALPCRHQRCSTFTFFSQHHGNSLDSDSANCLLSFYSTSTVLVLASEI